jgi:hypothetical protein
MIISPVMKLTLGLVQLFAFAVVPHVAEAKSKAKTTTTQTQSEIVYNLPAYDEILVAEADVVSNGEMAEMRAGFIDPSGLLFRFAVDVKSQIDGALMFVRSLVLETTSPGHYTASANNQVINENLPVGTTAAVIDNGAGVVVSSEKGTTTLMNQPSSSSFASVVVNQASDVVVSQTMNIDLVIQNVQASMRQLTDLKSFNAPAGLNQSAHMHTIGFGF